jgi:hypothetical protein
MAHSTEKKVSIGAEWAFTGSYSAINFLTAFKFFVGTTSGRKKRSDDERLVYYD